MKTVSLLGMLGLLAYLCIPARALPAEPAVWVPKPPDARSLTGEPPTCQGGCAQVMPERPHITAEEARKLLDTLSRETPDPASPTLEKILFYAASVNPVIEKEGTRSLSTQWVSLLQKELGRRFLRVEFRMRSEDGLMEVHMDRKYILGDKRRHLAEHAVGIQPPRLSLILHRVAFDRIWSRI